MILIQIVLILGLVVILGRFLASPESYRTKAWTKILTILFTLIAAVAVMLPNSVNSVAHLLGVTRGADLIFYILTLAFIFYVLSRYIKDKREAQRFALIVRKVAILEAELRRDRAK
jgi:hypothetical protein